MAADFMANMLHSIPRYTFMLKRVHTTFTLDLNSDYIQSLLVLATAVLFVGVVFLLSIIITWICQCCGRQNASAKSRRRVRQLSLILFILSVLCFSCLGLCLFGNEHLHHGITASVDASEEVSRKMIHLDSQCTLMDETRSNAMSRVSTLSTSLENESRKIASSNKTLLHNLETVIEGISKHLNALGENMDLIKSFLAGKSFEHSIMYCERFEFERWVLCATLLSIMLVVLFAGVIAFCRQSKKGAIVFSGLGFAIFIVGWLLFTAMFPTAVALADFCASGGAFMRNHLSNQTVELFEFYRECNFRPKQDNVPEVLTLSRTNKLLVEMQSLEQKLVPNIEVLFTNGREAYKLIEEAKLISGGVIHALKTFGALEANVACDVYHDAVWSMERGLCVYGNMGSSVLLCSLVLLEAFLFALLVIVSKSWHLFARLPSDYLEVDEEDPFFPRGNDSSIPVDIYGTHVFNPRTRTHFANSLDRTEQPAGTTAAAGSIANGSATKHMSASTALLDANADSTTPLWHPGISGTTNIAASNANAPPAVGTNSMISTGYPASNGDAAYRHRNYQERFDV